jgi:selenocysteine-specific elongation factor
MLDVRFELLDDYPREWKRDTRVRFHLGASERIGRIVLLEGESLAPGASALAQLRLEKPAVAARGDRFVIRSYSPARTVGGGAVIEPVATKRRRGADAALDTLALHESGSLEARVLERLGAVERPTAVAALAASLSAPEAEVSAALAVLREGGAAIEAGPGRWLGVARWQAAREAIVREVRAFADKFPARYGIMKGELKSGLRASLDAALFDAAFDALLAEGQIEQRGERVRPAGAPWEPPAETLRLLEAVEAELEAAGLAVPEVSAWQSRLGAAAAEVVALGFFLERFVRVSQELTYTTKQLEALRVKLAAWFEKKPALTMAEFKDLAGVSRKYSVPLLEHTDRIGWTARVGDERRRGGRLGA